MRPDGFHMVTDSALAGRAWLRSLAFLLAGLLAAYQALRIFYVLPWYGGATPLDRWFGRFSCVVPSLCGPTRLYLDHAGVALVVVSAVFFGLALYPQRSVFAIHESPVLPRWMSRPYRIRIACLIFVLTAFGLVVYEALSVGIQGKAPQVVFWLAGITGLLIAGVFWDYADSVDLKLTLSGLIIAAGGGLTLLGAAAAIISGYRSAWLVLAGLALIWLGVRLRPRSQRASQAIDILLALAISLLYLILALSRANAWQIADVGDEWHFYHVTRRILEQPDLLRAPFETHDPDGYHVMLSAGLQAAVMRIAGAGAVGWRLSSVLPVAWAIPGVYLFARWLGGRTLAWFSALLLAGAHVLLTFALIPYNNTQALLALGLALGAAAWAMASPGVLRLLVTGMVIGLGALLHSLVYLVVLPVYVLLVVQAIPDWRRVGASLAAITAGAVAVAAPLLFNPDHWRSLMKATPVQTEVGQIHSTHVQITRNVVSGAFDFLIDPTYRISHFVVGGRVDPVTAVLLIMGLALTVVAARRSRTAFAWVLTAAILLVSVSAIQQYGNVAVTRSFILLPAYAIFAGLGGLALAQLLTPYSPQLQRGLLVLLVVAALALNQFHVERISLPRSTDSWSEAAYVVRELQAAAALDKPGQVVVLHPEPEHSTLPTIAEAYGVAAYLSLADEANFVTGASGCPLSSAPVVLLPASVGRTEAVREYLGACWEGVETETLNGHDGEPVFYRLTPADEGTPSPQVPAQLHTSRYAR